MKKPTIDRQEWTWLAIVSACIVAFSTIPYIAGYLAETPEQQFGGAILNWLDYNTYLAKMWQGYRGNWGYEIAFTTEPHSPAFLIYIFYILLGHAARLTGLSLPAMYQVARVVFGFSMLIACYVFLAHFLQHVRTRRIAFLLSSATLGLGWLTQFLVTAPASEFGPMDFWFIDAYLYLALLTSPHFSASTAMSLLFFPLLLRNPTRPLSGRTGLAALLSVMIGLIHPYTLLLIDLLLLAYWVVDVVRKRWIPWRRTMAFAIVALSQMPLITYYYWLFYRKPVFSDWMGQTVCRSPPPHIYLFGYGLLLLPAIAGVVAWFRQRRETLVLPLIWVGLVTFLIFFPSDIQRRFVEGVQVPLGLLATVGLTEVLFPARGSPSRRRRRLFMQTLFVAFAMIGTLFVTAGLSLAAMRQIGNLSWSADLGRTADWLAEHAEYDETVLSGPETGNFLAGRAGHYVVVGHQMETLWFRPKVKAVIRFYNAHTSEAERVKLLLQWDVSYVIYGPEERMLGDFDPEVASWVDLAFETGSVRVYRVRLEGYE